MRRKESLLGEKNKTKAKAPSKTKRNPVVVVILWAMKKFIQEFCKLVSY